MQKIIEHAEIKLRERGILFTWDDEKEAINYRKHGIHFAEAVAVLFDDDVILERNSIDINTGEERLHAIGLLTDKILFVVHVERITVEGNDIIRIISARDATRKERRLYVDGHK